ncbi:hypothetical protein L1887_12304 [Cichorium endivia]|nr:hypothetical protein L1887_12304 [Cichorium endivia]
MFCMIEDHGDLRCGSLAASLSFSEAFYLAGHHTLLNIPSTDDFAFMDFRNGGITPRPTPLTEAKIETLGYDDCKTLALLAAAVRICHRRRFFSFLVIVVAFLISPTQ